MTYDMSDFLSSCVDRYCELAKITKDKLKKVATPSLDENSTRRESDSNDLVWPLSLGKKDTKEDTDELQEDATATATGKGKLADIACKVLMKVLYAARMCRCDLLKAIGALASRITKWDEICDAELHRLMSYIKSTVDVKLTSYVGDKA